MNKIINCEIQRSTSKMSRLHGF